MADIDIAGAGSNIITGVRTTAVLATRSCYSTAHHNRWPCCCAVGVARQGKRSIGSVVDTGGVA